mmetsp:Transcript_21125/g.51695  ORF Transcript_21125/g.51695 Transcript_21125/m.51695 type:complete len:212 (+) Transcript_21125:232-867(+)
MERQSNAMTEAKNGLANSGSTPTGRLGLGVCEVSASFELIENILPLVAIQPSFCSLSVSAAVLFSIVVHVSFSLSSRTYLECFFKSFATPSNGFISFALNPTAIALFTPREFPNCVLFRLSAQTGILRIPARTYRWRVSNPLLTFAQTMTEKEPLSKPRATAFKPMLTCCLRSCLIPSFSFMNRLIILRIIADSFFGRGSIGFRPRAEVLG